jgi:threonine/homoserine/homoserine lactone efflux protein
LVHSQGASVSGQIAAATGFLSAAMNPFSLPFFAATFLSRPEFADPRVALAAFVTIFLMALTWWASLGLILGRVAGLGRLNLSLAWRRALSAGLILCALAALWQGFAQFTAVHAGVVAQL